MPYCTEQNLIDRFNETELTELTDFDVLGVINSAKLAQVIGDVDAVIDGHIGSRYTLPLATTPNVLMINACDMVRYRLHKDGAPDEVINRNKAAMRFLERIQEGKATLGEQEASEDSSGNQVHTASGNSNTDWNTY
jgi:phage gp36-like protein